VGSTYIAKRRVILVVFGEVVCNGVVHRAESIAFRD